MARRGYIYLSGEDSKIEMFKEFLKIKKMTQKEIGELYMDAVMLTLDDKLYVDLKKKYLQITKFEKNIHDLT